MEQTLKPLRKFRIYIWKTKLYYLVHIWETKEQMYQYLKSKDNHDYECEAIVRTKELVDVYANGRKQLRPSLGEMHFHKNRLELEILTHETVHAVFGYCRRIWCEFSVLNRSNRKEGNVTDLEEGIAYVQGQFNHTLFTKLRKFNLINE
jgi:hypothetical protein